MLRAVENEDAEDGGDWGRSDWQEFVIRGGSASLSRVPVRSDSGQAPVGVCGLCGDAIERLITRGQRAYSMVVYRTVAEIMNSRTRRTQRACTVVVQIQRKPVAASGTTTPELQTSPPSSRSRRLPIVDGILRRVVLQRVKGVRIQSGDSRRAAVVESEN